MAPGGDGADRGQGADQVVDLDQQDHDEDFADHVRAASRCRTPGGLLCCVDRNGRRGDGPYGHVAFRAAAAGSAAGTVLVSAVAMSLAAKMPPPAVGDGPAGAKSAFDH
ncbi:hypothetical protein GCM10022255_093960 [Dactylosporangium darangshiense]|uniref:Uncharacterized protein n=1 Tax=Dactylosporangium darangshiense TaxID=579108 RepID=A0ABP8DQ34_9ACTN